LHRDGNAWLALAKPAKRLRPGTELEFPARHPGFDPLAARILENLGEGKVRVDLGELGDGALEHYGTTPLPPYIAHTLADDERYQTVYNKEIGSAAAPTAGLHFTHELLTSLEHDGIHWAEITLHVGLDTFRPVTADRIQDHEIHREWFEVPLETSLAIARARAAGGRVVAVGTTVARTLETIGPKWDDELPRAATGMTDTFIVPGHRWSLVNGLLTNFHLPRSSLLMLVSAFATRELIMRAYAEAIESRYRFFSFGDAMLIL
jgi:S-adenosylmethionine:tRNA ribosyltransferase-isomerase